MINSFFFCKLKLNGMYGMYGMYSFGDLGRIFETAFFVCGTSPGSAGFFLNATQIPKAGHPKIV
jgi:hypothetical protein